MHGAAVKENIENQFLRKIYKKAKKKEKNQKIVFSFFTTSNSLKLVLSLSVTHWTSVKNKSSKTNQKKGVLKKQKQKKKNFEKSIKPSWSGR